MLPAGRDIVDFKPLIGKKTPKVELEVLKTIIINGASFMLGCIKTRRCPSIGSHTRGYDKAETSIV